MKRLVFAIGFCFLILGSSSASADPVSDAMLAELREAGLPGVSVTVATPPAATATDVAAFDADPTLRPSSLSLEAMLSLDPTHPLPVATVKFGQSSVTPISGLLSPPGGSVGYEAIEDAQFPIWRQAVMSAVRHRIAAGASLAGAAMQPQFPNRPTPSEPDLLLATPATTWWPAGAGFQLLSANQVRQKVVAGLPPWALTTDVTVTDYPLRGRIVSLKLSITPFALESKAAELVAYANSKQAELNKAGARIASTAVRVVNVVDGTPLLTSASDVNWGQFFAWAAPTMRAFIDSASGRGDPAPSAVLDGAADSTTAGIPPP